MQKALPVKSTKELSDGVLTLLISALTLLISSAITRSIPIGISFSILSGASTVQFLKQRSSKKQRELGQVWPEVIDHLISGLYSGLSITEALSELAIRGPVQTRKAFTEFNHDIRKGIELSVAMEQLRTKFSHHRSDQIFEALLLSKTLGGGELLNTLRTLAVFQREDLMLSKEISIKHGWIKNSAHISAAAPWLLLLMIGTQPGTASAFSSSGGILILGFGLVATIFAYLWMSYLSKLPEPPRVFGVKN